MLDFAALPPEVNSARMYAGPGSAPMMAAASAWDTVAAQLESLASSYSSVTAELLGQSWSGGASVAMATAATPYVEWATEAAANAEQAANQARAAAAAYEAAFAATVPPAAVVANRIQLATLVATNFFGQNTMLIAATEIAYAEMWAVDAAAMYGYAASASAASTLAPFREPPQTTSPTGQSGQAAAVAHAAGAAAHSQTAVSQLMPALPQQLHTLSATESSASSPSGSWSILPTVSGLDTLYGPTDFAVALARSAAMVGDFVTEANMYGFQSGAAAAAVPAPTATTATLTVGPSHPVYASVGRADPVGQLSVPQSWATKTPAAGSANQRPQLPRKISRVLPPWAGDPAKGTLRAAPAAGTGPLAPMAAPPTRKTVLRMPTRRYRMPFPAVGG